MTVHWLAQGLVLPSVSITETVAHVFLICEHVALLHVYHKIAKPILEVPFISW